jgi:type IV pilus assembly protein PilE
MRLHRRRLITKGSPGFSLTELMVVLVIIGILTLLALPRFSTVITRARMVEARTMLSHAHTLQQTYHYEYDRYGESIIAIGFEQSPLVSDGGTGRYVIAVERADMNAYMMTATSIVDFNRNGTFNVWEVDETGVVRERTPD